MEDILGWKSLHEGGIWETNCSLEVNGVGVRVTKAQWRGKPESLPYQNDGAENQLKQNGAIIFKLSPVEHSVSSDVICDCPDRGDRTSKKK